MENNTGGLTLSSSRTCCKAKGKPAVGVRRPGVEQWSRAESRNKPKPPPPSCAGRTVRRGEDGLCNKRCWDERANTRRERHGPRSTMKSSSKCIKDLRNLEEPKP